MGAPALPSGSRASHEAPTGLHPSGFDPSRSHMIPFTQYLLPDGRKKSTFIGVHIDVADRAREIIAKGLAFECELLTTGEASFTITDPEKGDLDIRVVPNGPGVREAIEEMVRSLPLDGGGL
jgi:hypothetical protein